MTRVYEEYANHPLLKGRIEETLCRCRMFEFEGQQFEVAQYVVRITESGVEPKPKKMRGKIKNVRRNTVLR